VLLDCLWGLAFQKVRERIVGLRHIADPQRLRQWLIIAGIVFSVLLDALIPLELAGECLNPLDLRRSLVAAQTEG
jgi:hypothetical protein